MDCNKKTALWLPRRRVVPVLPLQFICISQYRPQYVSDRTLSSGTLSASPFSVSVKNISAVTGGPVRTYRMRLFCIRSALPLQSHVPWSFPHSLAPWAFACYPAPCLALSYQKLPETSLLRPSAQMFCWVPFHVLSFSLCLILKLSYAFSRPAASDAECLSHKIARKHWKVNEYIGFSVFPCYCIPFYIFCASFICKRMICISLFVEFLIIDNITCKMLRFFHLGSTAAAEGCSLWHSCSTVRTLCRTLKI